MEKIIDYRKKHKRCKWCKYEKFVYTDIVCCPSYYKCILKDKIIHSNLKAIFCSYYELKEFDFK